jgi:hypothetical protein
MGSRPYHVSLAASLSSAPFLLPQGVLSSLCTGAGRPFSFLSFLLSLFISIMDYAIPKISISLAPPEDPVPDPTSPFTSLAFASKIADSDGFRPSHLTPPPTPTSLKRALSPPPTQDTATGLGLDSHRFQALLNATRERGVGKKHVDLRKEIALKVHKNKQGMFSSYYRLLHLLKYISS